MSIFRRPHEYIVGRLRRKSAAVLDRPGSEWEQPSMSVVTVKFEGTRGSGRAQDQFFSGAWFSCVEQKDRQKGLFFNLGCTGREASFCRGKLSAGR